VRRVATLGDGWFPLLSPDETARAAIERLHAYARAAGREPHSIGIEGAVEIAGKTPDEWRRAVEAWGALGATRIGVYMLDAGLASLQAHVDMLARFKEAIASSEHT
jgi:alkanesulfonate monooxygenase SsuD/methylene tetrahydromethanopterin reductase-like flavin-dependent oxidoreductase (luciferase family)